MSNLVEGAMAFLVSLKGDIGKKSLGNPGEEKVFSRVCVLKNVKRLV